jgi:hypothetical protein
MDGNIVDLLKQQLAPQLVSKVTEVLGVSPETARGAVGGAIPAMLASFLHAGSTPGGAGALGDALAQATRVGDAGAQSGSTLLSTLLGEGKLQALAAALGSFAGLSSGQASSLLGMIAPMVLGFLGRQPSVAGQGAQGLMALLSSQKDAIMSAMPSELSSMLGSSGLLSGLSGIAQGGRSAIAGTAAGIGATATAAGTASAQAAQAAAAQAKAAAATAQSAASRTSWLWPALGVLAIIIVGGTLWSYLSGSQVQQTTQQAANQATNAAQQASDSAQQAAGAAQQAAQTAMAGGVDLAKGMSGSLSQLSQTLGGITDAATAQAAVPQLQTIIGDVDKMKGLAGQLPQSGRAVLANIMKQAMPAVQAAVDKVYAIPGAPDVLKPVVDPLMTSLGNLQQQLA